MSEADSGREEVLQTKRKMRAIYAGLLVQDKARLMWDEYG